MKESSASRLRRKPITVSSRKIKLVCSFNGIFHVRPPSNKLRYIGGETRIISVDRNIGFSKLRSKMSDLCPKLRSFSLKYQLLISGSGLGSGSDRGRNSDNEADTDAPLVSIALDEDVRCMIEEYDKLELYGKHARLWVFIVCDDNDECESDNNNTNKNGNRFVKGNNDLCVNYLESDGLRNGAKACKVQFDDKVTKTNTAKDVGRVRFSDDSLRKMVLRQQLLAKQSEETNSVSGVNCGEFASCDENNKQKYEHPLRVLASEPNTLSSRRDLYQGKILGYRIGYAHLQGSESCGCLVENPSTPLYPLKPRDGNLLVETHCSSEQNFQVFGRGTGIANSSATSIPKDLGVFKQGSTTNLNRENIMPWSLGWVSRSSNSQWDRSNYPLNLKSLCTGEIVWGGYQNGIRNHRFVINDARNHRVYPYQIRNHRKSLVEMGSPRSIKLDRRLSAAKCYPGLRPNSTISKQGQSMRLHGSNSRKPGFTENMMEQRISKSFSSLNKDKKSFFRLLREQSGYSVQLYGNSKSEDYHLACHGGRAVLDDQSFLAHAVAEGPPPCVEKMESQQDLLTGSLYEMHNVPYQNVHENYHSLSINSELLMFDQQKGVSISGLSNDMCSDNEVAAEFNNKMVDTGMASEFFGHQKNGTHYLQEGVASSVELLHNLSLSSSHGVETPAPSSLDSGNVADSLLKPKSKPVDFVDRQPSQVPKADKSNVVASNSSALNADSMKKDQLHKEEIQQDLPSSLSIEEKVETKESIKCSKVVGGIACDVAAVYTHLATQGTQGLQSIRSSDLEYIKELGSGTYGTVYHGKWKGSDVAIKRIKPSCFTEGSLKEDRLVADFWKEAHILGQLHHPNIVAFYGVVTDGPANNLATVTEYMVNGSLKQVLQRKDRIIDRRKRIILAMDAAFGMEYLHEKNIVHFDLKSHNFLVNMRDPQRPVCKIGDLGLSKIKQRTLVSGGVRGTIPWMAPELLNCKNNMVTEKIDVYSFGIVMWEVLTGEEPYANLHSEEIIAGIIKGNLRPEIPNWCDPAWRSLMERCWSFDPESRPAFSEIAKELRAMSAAMNIR
ncbi:hypothetical protein JCGZ_13291 [Jatropha curcas]|uniref:Protein kinase domain-containing protein n=1 Tax=Jatropha curcas TaxID=180498 RepID=A0A067K803_JATCU|nr:hypothetical protein JCGZ_13291 [Jatropha curcas]